MLVIEATTDLVAAARIDYNKFLEDRGIEA